MANAVSMPRPHRARRARAGSAQPRRTAADAALFEAGAVDQFVAFTGVVRREPLVATGCPEARSVDELEYVLGQLLK